MGEGGPRFWQTVPHPIRPNSREILWRKPQSDDTEVSFVQDVEVFPLLLCQPTRSYIGRSWTILSLFASTITFHCH